MNTWNIILESDKPFRIGNRRLKGRACFEFVLTNYGCENEHTDQVTDNCKNESVTKTKGKSTVIIILKVYF